MMDRQSALERYAAAWRALQPEDVSALESVLAPSCRFVDPFNDVSGRDAVIDMLAKSYRRFRSVAVEVQDSALGATACYLRWRYTFETRKGRRFPIEGMSEICFDDDGRATLHRDHWDAAAQFYEKLPLIGRVLRMVRRQV